MMTDAQWKEFQSSLRGKWLEAHLTPELQAVIDLGYLRHDAPEDVKKDYLGYCRQFEKPHIRLARRPGASYITLLMSTEETMKPTRRVSGQIGKLSKAWAERLYPGKNAYLDLSGKEGGVPKLTEEQALALASEIWAIVGQAGAYEIIEPPEEFESEDGESEDSE